MGDMNLVAVVPMEVANTITSGVDVNYNSMPDLHPNVIKVIREFMIDNVGFENLPIACLASNSKILSLDDIVGTGISYNYKDSVLFQMKIPEDMIVSTRQESLTEASVKFQADANDRNAMIKLKNSLTLGDSADSNIYFIPFIDLSMCSFYSVPQGAAPNFQLSGVEHRKVTELAIFTK